MFVFNLKIKGKKLAAAAAIVSVAAAVICAAATVAVNSKPQDSTFGKETGEYSLVLKKGSEDEFLEQFGLESRKAEPQSRNVVIPTEFNKYYEDYNELQKSIGLNLEKYKGREAQEIRIPLKKPKNYTAVLLVIKNRVIGGHITDGEYGSQNLSLAEYNGKT